MNVLISEYHFGFVVCEAKPYSSQSIIGYETIERGYNIWGDCLGTFQRAIYSPTKYIEGDSISQSFKTKDQAKQFIQTINATEVERNSCVKES